MTSCTAASALEAAASDTVGSHFCFLRNEEIGIKTLIVKMEANKDNLHVEFYQYLYSAHTLTGRSKTAPYVLTASSFARGSSATGSSSVPSVTQTKYQRRIKSLRRVRTIKKPNLTGQISGIMTKRRQALRVCNVQAYVAQCLQANAQRALETQEGAGSGRGVAGVDIKKKRRRGLEGRRMPAAFNSCTLGRRYDSC